VVLDAPELAGSAEARLDLVDDEHDAVVVADLAHSGKEFLRSDDEAALALHGLDHDRRNTLGRDLSDERPLEGGERLERARAAVVLRERNAVDVWCERAEARLVRMCLRGEGQ